MRTPASIFKPQNKIPAAQPAGGLVVLGDADPRLDSGTPVNALMPASGRWWWLGEKQKCSVEDSCLPHGSPAVTSGASLQEA